VQAERFGRAYEYPETRLEIHLACAFATLASLPFVLVTGWRLRRRPRWRRAHRRSVAAFVALTFAAVATAIWMLLDGEPAAA